MKKKFLSLALCSMVTLSALTGCGTSGEQTGATQSKFEMLDTDLRVGMVTDSGTIDDRSFNQGSWEGISYTVKNAKYIKPAGITDADYLDSISNLNDADYKFIVAPGFKFERAIGIAQEKYADTHFVILDGQPSDESGNYVVADNTVAIFFAEEQSGFLAGIAAAVEMKNSEFGFIGGMELPAVQRFNWGFQQGVAYANENLGTTISLKEENVVYQGAFDDKAGGQVLTYAVSNNGVGIPTENPNLSENTLKTVQDVYAKIQSGEITIASTNDGSLIK